MEDKILRAIQYIRLKCKKRVTSQNIFSFLNKGTSIVDAKLFHEVLNKMEIEGYIFKKGRGKNVRTVRYGIETASFVGPRIWNSIPKEIKESASLQIFKSKIKSWTPKNCPCKLCKNYVQHVGYL